MKDLRSLCILLSFALHYLDFTAIGGSSVWGYQLSKKRP
ncbi:Uncharacterised protein [Legionella pneumophila]|nr:hypothetical protein [Legionella pneumophila subsp. pneumophila]CZG30712.1 Uncharacterised protein [Legionella pneumophila]CZG41560.1 Uncharacterised protein [Legionella pneumophila]CZG70417.1 Uncharacterised protein [Legionella pneumophila]CZG87815.1 Uncharacterised protein [Legionella pneumophila]